MCFLRLAAASKLEGAIANTDMTAPGLREACGLIRSGQISLGSYDGQLLYAKVLLRESLRMMKLPRFEESIRRMF